MRFTRVHLQNWKNFLDVNVLLEPRVFLVGPNAAGKSNFLDAFRFLRDIADPQGGFQKATASRRGVSQMRSLHARRYPNIVLEVEVAFSEGEPNWKYRIEFSQDNQRRPIVKKEFVQTGDKILLDRPNSDDRGDESRLTQTHLEQVNANKEFRVLQEGFAKIRYLHIVPQILREPDRSLGHKRDPYGADFLEQVASAPNKTRDSRLRRIVDALKVAVPQLKTLELHRDDRGVPHLRGLHSHWRPNAGWQTEDQFSDGTLRLLGLLWSLLDGAEPLLLEEPELSLHEAVIRRLPPMMARLARKAGRQVLVSTHSPELLADRGIAPEEVLLLRPLGEGTHVDRASDLDNVRELLTGGLPMPEAVMPMTAPQNLHQLSFFGDR